mmetsp:Transcript_1544/g.5274  ORF Transcript_1544/g.5274 Transcript_1544/m.5274 type:complete len:325 (-) Transcript_1544:152-1126(-)
MQDGGPGQAAQGLEPGLGAHRRGGEDRRRPRAGALQEAQAAGQGRCGERAARAAQGHVPPVRYEGAEQVRDAAAQQGDAGAERGPHPEDHRPPVPRHALHVLPDGGVHPLYHRALRRRRAVQPAAPAAPEALQRGAGEVLHGGGAAGPPVPPPARLHIQGPEARERAAAQQRARRAHGLRPLLLQPLHAERGPLADPPAGLRALVQRRGELHAPRRARGADQLLRGHGGVPVPGRHQRRGAHVCGGLVGAGRAAARARVRVHAVPRQASGRHLQQHPAQGGRVPGRRLGVRPLPGAHHGPAGEGAHQAPGLRGRGGADQAPPVL